MKGYFMSSTNLSYSVPAFLKLKSFLTRADKFKCIIISILALFSSALELITAAIIILFAQTINDINIGQTYAAKIGLEHKFSSIQILLFIICLCGLSFMIKNIVAGFSVFQQNLYAQQMETNFRQILLRRYSQLYYGLHLTRNSATAFSTIYDSIHIVYTLGVMGIAGAASEIIVFFSLISFITYLHPMMSLFIFGFGTLTAVIVTRNLLPSIYRHSSTMQESYAKSNKHLLQLLHSFKEIILLNKQEYFIKTYNIDSSKGSYSEAMRTAIKELPRLFIESLFVGFFMIAIGVLCVKSQNPSELLGIFGGYLYVGFRIMPGLNRIIQQFNMFKSAIPAINRVHDEYNLDLETETYLDLPELSFQKSIDLNNVSFQYLNTKREALSHINLTIMKGECIGIAGETGSGKSTLIDIVLGLLKPTEGEILIDSLYPANSLQWHHKIGYVPQSLNLIDDTIAANIAFGIEPENYDLDLLHKVIDDAQLTKFLAQLPDGINTIVGEKGVRLSGGEKQRIAIARALYINPEVLIFDEATSALDNETEAKLMGTIYSVSKNRTVIMIAHRLSTLEKCDRIVNMKNAKMENVTNYSQFIKDNQNLIKLNS